MIMKEILPVIMNTSFERLAVIDDYVSFIWSSRYYESGDFELCLDTSRTNIDLIQKDYYVIRDDDENAGIIENIVIQSNEDGQELLIVSGRFLQSILGRRIIAVQTTVDGAITACVSKLIRENIINPDITERKIDNFYISNPTVSTQMKAQYTGKNLLETISDICKTYGLGFKIVFDDQHNFIFSLYAGENHTYDQDELPYVIFSDRYDNLLSSEYSESYQNLTTAVLVAGEGEGLDRKTKWVSTTATGLARREMYKDQRQLQSDGGEISDADYEDILEESGKESLTQYTAAFTGNVLFDNVRYKEDVQLGDLVVIENARWGIRMNTRLVEVIESVGESGEYSIVPTFGV